MAFLRSTVWAERITMPNSPEYVIDGDRSRSVRTIDIVNSTNLSLPQAFADFLGYARLANKTLLGGPTTVLTGSASSIQPTTAAYPNIYLISSSAASSRDGAYVGNRITITSGTGSGQARTIIGYVAATTFGGVTKPIFIVDIPWTTQPKNTSAYAVTIPAKTNYVSRIIPHQDPMLAWLYAEQVARAIGVGNDLGTGTRNQANANAFTIGDPAGFNVNALAPNAPFAGGYAVNPADFNTGAENVFKLADYNFYRLTIAYTARSYDIVSDSDMIALSQNAGFSEAIDANNNPDESSLFRNVTRIFRPGTTALTLPNKSLYFVSTGAVGGAIDCPSNSIPKLLPDSDVAYRWENVPLDCIPSNFFNTLTWPAIENSLGKINLVAFDGQPGGTMLLNAVELEPARQADGSRSYHLVYRFKFRDQVDLKPAGAKKKGSFVNSLRWDSTGGQGGGGGFVWNEIVATKLGVPAELWEDGQHVYDAVDMNNLFRVGNILAPVG